jgi:predicted permease
MNEYWTVLNAVLPIFGVMCIGLLLRRVNWLTEEADHSLLRITVNVLYPCLILDSILGNEGLKHFGTILVGPVLGFVTSAGGCFVALACARFFGVTEAKQRRAFAYTVGIFNYGYIPIPLVQLLFDRATLGVLFLFILGVEVALWTVGLIILTGAAREGWRKLLNPPVIAVLAGLALNFSGALPFVPKFPLVTVKMLGASAIPLALIMIGATVADYLGDFPAHLRRTQTRACRPSRHARRRPAHRRHQTLRRRRGDRVARGADHVTGRARYHSVGDPIRPRVYWEVKSPHAKNLVALASVPMHCFLEPRMHTNGCGFLSPPRR